MKIRESAEMYLETILVLSQQGEVHSVDIARAMGFSKPTISVTIHALADDKYIKIKPDGTISLMAKGQKIAESIYERHIVIGKLLEALGVSHETAVSDACKIEHDISDETFNCIKLHAEKHAK